MHTDEGTVRRRGALTLIELIVVVSIVVFLVALGAAFAPRVSDSQNLTRAVDQLEQWLLTARMRAKRDALATGLRFLPDPSNPGTYAEFQYVQQPDSIAGGYLSADPVPGAVPYNSLFLTGGICTGIGGGQAQFANVDFTAGGAPPGQFLVQPGDYLELYGGGGVHLITAVTGSTSLQLSSDPFDAGLTLDSPTTNYRILRQPRPLLGEPTMTMPKSLAADMNPIPGTAARSNVQSSPGGQLEVVFAPSGAVVGANACNGKVLIYVHDVTQPIPDPGRAGVVAVQTRTGFIAAYDLAPGADPFRFAQEGRSSGL
jgi:type II secretory pathway pseudopilin PulG